MAESLSAKEAAELLGIHESTVRRGAGGRLRRLGRDRYVLTGGNPIDDLPGATLREEPIPDPEPPDGDEWADLTDPDVWEPRTPTLMASRDVRMVVVVSDVHIPEHDGRAWAAFLDFLADTQPHAVVIAGDFLELGSCSGHPGSLVLPESFMEDIRAGNRALDEIQAAAPAATMAYLEGNHETRLTRSVVAKHPALLGAVTIPEQLRLRERGVRWLPEGKPLRLGHLRIVHGWWSSKYHAAKHLDELGVSVMYGHTHRPQVHTKGTGDGATRGAWGLPCMRTLDPSWMNGRPGGWLHGFGIVHVWPDDLFTAQLITMTDRRFAYAGKVYGG